ncbi:unannotated protein [freshwater metagenome]
MVPLTVLRSLSVAVVIGASSWMVSTAVDPHGRIACLALVAGLSVIGGLGYLVGVRLMGANITLNPRGWLGNPTIESARR